mgnify:CR=1 FL=1
MADNKDNNSLGWILGITALIGAGVTVFEAIRKSKENKNKTISYDNPKPKEQEPTIEQNNKNVNSRSRGEEKLNAMIGLEGVKQKINIVKASFAKQKALGNKVDLNFCFYGNPGTGKTEVARLVGRIFYEKGLLPTPNFYETDRSGLVGEYIGQTAPKTHEIFKKALGGVLFIDEAYTLSASGDNDFGKEAVAALLKDMEDYRGKICVILAGYKAEMNKMFEINPGFKSRIRQYVDFPDYSSDEIKKIISFIAKKEKYTITESALNAMTKIVMKRAGQPNFANAREARNVYESVRDVQALRTEGNMDTKIIYADVLEYAKLEKIDID